MPEKVLRASTVGLDRLERAIQPPLGRAITLPLLIDGKDSGISIYVGMSAFAEIGAVTRSHITDDAFKGIALEIARRINKEFA